MSMVYETIYDHEPHVYRPPFNRPRRPHFAVAPPLTVAPGTTQPTGGAAPPATLPATTAPAADDTLFGMPKNYVILGGIALGAFLLLGKRR